MLQRFVLVILIGFLLNSCDFFQKKKIDEDQLIDTIIDFNSVDMFPLFPDCEDIPSQEKQRICTQIKLSEHLYASLHASQIKTLRKINDTVLLKLKIDAEGRVALIAINASDLLNQQLPKMDSLIKNGVANLPILKPAIKRGIPVATEFSLAIVVVN